MASPDYDLVIVGGGIHGVGVAHQAALRGLRVCVLEQRGLAAGTSSRSSKLIHGGLRYLEGGHFGLVRECLRERAYLVESYPDLVRLTPHYIPVYRRTRRRPWQIRTGLSLYALFGGLGPAVRFRKVPKADWAALDHLDTHDLQAVYQYSDGQTDDAALTRYIMTQAQALGAHLEPAAFRHARWEGDEFRVSILAGGVSVQLAARNLVNAAGPWVNQVAERIDGGHRLQPIDWVAGTHCVFDRPLHTGVFYVESPQDGRAIFVMPWQESRTLVGTTERPYAGDPAQVEPTAEEMAYLQHTLCAYFPDYRDARMLEAFAGLRVLPRAQGAASARSRETRLVTGAQGHLVSIYGGKLTAFRATAQKALAALGSG